jgi:uncharacterized membrane protein YjjP (DUF1212 family)
MAATRSFVLENGGRKFWLVLIVIMFAFLSEAFALGISRETIRDCLIAAVGGSGAIALEDSLRALFGQKKAVPIDDGEKAEE